MVADANLFTRDDSAGLTKERSELELMIGCIYKFKVFKLSPTYSFIHTNISLRNRFINIKNKAIIKYRTILIYLKMRYSRYLMLINYLQILFIEIIDYILIIFEFIIIQVILFKILIKILLFYSILKTIINKFKSDNLLYYLFNPALNSNIL